jgi:hypothetical protein
MSADHPETPASVTIGALGYRARCTKVGCGKLARRGLRRADAGSRPMNNVEFCYAHALVRIARDWAAALKVFDDR